MGLFQQISEQAGKRGLPFLVIGGLAVNLHGYSRDTADLDLLIDRAAREHWLVLFSELGYTVHREAGAFIQLDPPTQGAWPADLMLVQQATFELMRGAALDMELYGARVLIPTVEHLLALKLHALKHGHIGRYLKDYLDAEGLIRLHRIDLRLENIRQMFEKHGTVELYEKLSRTSLG